MVVPFKQATFSLLKISNLYKGTGRLSVLLAQCVTDTNPPTFSSMHVGWCTPASWGDKRICVCSPAKPVPVQLSGAVCSGAAAALGAGAERWEQDGIPEGESLAWCCCLRLCRESRGQSGAGSLSRRFSEMLPTHVWHVWSLPPPQHSDALELNARVHIWKEETAVLQRTNRLQGLFCYKLSSLPRAAAGWVSCSINIVSLILTSARLTLEMIHSSPRSQVFWTVLARYSHEHSLQHLLWDSPTVDMLLVLAQSACWWGRCQLLSVTGVVMNYQGPHRV